MPKKPHFTKQYARYRIRDPKKFVKTSMRTDDIGRPGHSKRIAGRLKATGKWATQAILITKKDYKKGMRVVYSKDRRPLIKKVYR